MLGLIIDTAHQSIFDAYATFRSQVIVMCRIKHLRSIETLVHWNELVSQLIARSVQGHGQTYRNAFCREFLDTWYHTDRGDGDVACRNAETFRWHGADLAYSAQYGLVIAHRFAHAHEHDVAQAPETTSDFAVVHGFRGHTNLFQNLACRHVSRQTQLTCGTERAAHSTAYLAGNA